MISIPAFGEACCRENRENKNSHVFNIPDVDEGMFDAYCVLFENSGFVKKESYKKSVHQFAAYTNGFDGVFLNYFDSI